MRLYAIASVEYILSIQLLKNKCDLNIITYYCNIASLSTKFVFFSTAVLIHCVKEGGWREFIKLLSWNFTEHRSQEKIHFWCGLNEMRHIRLEINLSGDGLQISLIDKSLFFPWGGGGSWVWENFGCAMTNSVPDSPWCSVLLLWPPPPLPQFIGGQFTIIPLYIMLVT